MSTLSNDLGLIGRTAAAKSINTLRSRQNGRHFADDTFKYIFLNENVIISAKISLKFDNIPALVQIMAWRRPGDKPLSEPMMVSLPTHICVTRPQWVKACVMIPALMIGSNTTVDGRNMYKNNEKNRRKPPWFYLYHPNHNSHDNRTIIIRVNIAVDWKWLQIALIICSYLRSVEDCDYWFVLKQISSSYTGVHY